MVGPAASVGDRRMRVPRFFSSITIILAPLYPDITGSREHTNSMAHWDGTERGEEVRPREVGKGCLGPW